MKESMDFIEFHIAEDATKKTLIKVSEIVKVEERMLDRGCFIRTKGTDKLTELTETYDEVIKKLQSLFG